MLDSKVSDNRLNVVICWHMHQPQYANCLKDEYQLPWTYLHAIKDYTDMAAHLEAEPGAKAVVNFAPILLEQLDDYAQKINRFLSTGKEIGDPLLSTLASAVLPVDVEQRMHIVKNCLRINKARLIDRFPHFKRLAELADWFTHHPNESIYINSQFLVDLLMWYHLAWLGETIRRQDDRVKSLIEKENGYSYQDRRILISIIGELVSGIIPRYRRLLEKGQVELSISPYAHPIVPLMIDIQSAKQAMPDGQLPVLEQYPGGEARAEWHIKHGIDVFRQYFGSTPIGCWPSEGSVSIASSQLFERCGFKWIASGEKVLHNSLNAISDEPHNPQAAYSPYILDEGQGKQQLRHFFRDDGLSDLVGFTYSEWHADDAVSNLVHNLENISQAAGDNAGSRVVSIILDGENAWEYYPENGYYFLSAMYKALADNDHICLTTFSDCIDEHIETLTLQKMVAGSWVYGSFSTWIGDAYKNRAWDMLGEAKRCFDRSVQTGILSAEQIHAAERQLAICEGSDWFWWFGDYNPSNAVSEFDRLYRMQLVNLYQVLGEPPPEYLSHVFSHGGGEPQHGGVMRRAS